MRVPESSVLQSRARVAFAQLQVWHLSHLSLQSLDFLSSVHCPLLHALYVDNNRLTTLLRNHATPSSTSTFSFHCFGHLWHLDLSHNSIAQIDALRTLKCIGWLNLSHNLLSVASLLSLREVHVLDIKLEGNAALVDPVNRSRAHTRMRLASLLPNAWAIDGHFVTQPERQQAEAAMEPFVQALLVQQQEKRLKARMKASAGDNASGLAAPAPAPAAEATPAPAPAAEVTPAPAAPEANAHSVPHFGSMEELWGVDPAEENPHHQRFLDLLYGQPTKGGVFAVDCYRLRQLVVLYNEEAALHNAHIQFAPSKHWTNGQKKPLVPQEPLKTLTRREKMQLAVVLMSHLELRLPKQLATELLHVILIDNSAFTASIIDDLLSLPPFGVAFVLLELCTWANHKNNTFSHSPLEQQMWKSIPVPVTTLLGRKQRTLPPPTPQKQPEDDASCHRQRCRYTLLLLSHTSVFPQLEQPFLTTTTTSTITSDPVPTIVLPSASTTDSNNRNNNNYHHHIKSHPGKPQQLSRLQTKFLHELQPLLNAAQVTSLDQALNDPFFEYESERPWVAGFRFQPLPLAQEDEEDVALQLPRRLYDKPWSWASSSSLNDSATTPSRLEELDSTLTAAAAVAAKRKPTPKVGDWLELRQRQYARITCVSESESVVVIGPMQQGANSFQPSLMLDDRATRLLSFHVSQLTRISSTIWRLVDVCEEELEEIVHKVAQMAAFHVNRLGRLHRESTEFHHHGAPRNQGFPNEQVTPKDLQSMEQTSQLIGRENWLARQPQRVEAFSANNTLDANYVLASPTLISIQNYCATRNNKLQQPQSLYTCSQSADKGWSPIKQTPFTMVDPCAHDKKSSASRVKNTIKGEMQSNQRAIAKPLTLASCQSCPTLEHEELDDWKEIQSEMKQLLCKRKRASIGSHEPPPTEHHHRHHHHHQHHHHLHRQHQQAEHSNEDVRFFLTSISEDCSPRTEPHNELWHAPRDLRAGAARTDLAEHHVQPVVPTLRTTSSLYRQKQPPSSSSITSLPAATVLLSQKVTQEKLQRSASCSRVTGTSWRALGTKPECLVANPMGLHATAALEPAQMPCNVPTRAPTLAMTKSEPEARRAPSHRSDGDLNLRTSQTNHHHFGGDVSTDFSRYQPPKQLQEHAKETSTGGVRLLCVATSVSSLQQPQEAAEKVAPKIPPPVKVATAIVLPALIPREEQNTVQR